MAPVPFNETKEFEKLDPVTKQPILDENGSPVMETLIRMGARFKTVSVFDVSSTEGEALPELAENISGDVEHFELFMDTLRAISPLPIVFENLPPDVDGTCHFGDRISIREGMSEIQTLSAAVHELSHALLHDRNSLAEGEKPKSKQVIELEAESIAYSVLSRYNIDTGANSFGYLASWQPDKEMKDFKASLDIIRKTASDIIDNIDKKYRELAKERGIDLSAKPAQTAELGAEQNYNMIDGIANNESPKADPIRERLIPISQTDTQDEKYNVAFTVLTDALCANEELLALANTGAEWQHGGGRTAIFGGDYYEALVNEYAAEMSDLIADKAVASRLNNAVLGEAYRRLDGIAYNRFVLDEYAEITKSGRLEIYQTPQSDNDENADISVHLTERLQDGNTHDYGIIFSYDPNDTRDHAINNYLSLIDFAVMRESVFGKPETSVTMTYKETEPVGSTVLRRLLFNDMNFNRELKRTRVEILPPMGKYSVYARRLSNVTTGDNTAIYIGTNSGFLLPLSVDRTNFEKRYFEAYIDRMFERASAELDAMLADPGKFAMYQQAAMAGRIDEAEAHNDAYKAAKIESDSERRAEIAAQQAAIEKEAKRQHVAEITANAETLASGGKFEIEASRYSGKNNLLELFSLYDIDVPLATKGWFNNKLVRFEVMPSGGYSYGSYQNKGRRASLMSDSARSKLNDLRRAVQTIPIAEKLAQKRFLDADEMTEIGVKNTMEHKLYEQFAALYPQIASGEYSYMKLESSGFEPLSIEYIGENEISVMHTYVMNGDLCYDPMITFEMDKEAKILTATSFEQSIPPLYQRVTEQNGDGQSVDGNGRESTIRNLQGKLNDFAKTWFDNLEQQGHIPVRATIAGLDENAEVTFNADGKPIMPQEKTPDAESEKQAELDLSLPDPTVTAAKINEYGYTYDGMLPMTTARAVELFDTGHPIYLLYPDNTEAMAYDRDEIRLFDGFCGIETDDWHNSPVYKAQMAIAGNASKIDENSRESELIHSSISMFGIYQIPDDSEENRNFRFASLRELEAHGLAPNRADYSLVYTAPLTSDQREPEPILNSIYEDFNMNHPPGYTSHSISVSDVIVLQQNGTVSSYYVDNVGFKELSGFLDDETPQKKEKQQTIEPVKPQQNQTKQPPLPKTKPSLLAGLEQGKRIAAEMNKTARKINERGNQNERDIHG